MIFKQPELNQLTQREILGYLESMCVCYYPQRLTFIDRQPDMLPNICAHLKQYVTEAHMSLRWAEYIPHQHLVVNGALDHLLDYIDTPYIASLIMSYKHMHDKLLYMYCIDRIAFSEHIAELHNLGVVVFYTDYSDQSLKIISDDKPIKYTEDISVIGFKSDGMCLQMIFDLY